MPIHLPRRLGKRQPEHDARTVKLNRYITRAILPPPKPSIDWAAAIPSWPMLANDQLGDCTIAAGPGHMTHCWSANASTPVILTDAQIIKAYSDFCGYVPGVPSTDNGGVELRVLRKWRRRGVAGYKIDAFVSVDLGPAERSDTQVAIEVFGGLYTGFSLPASAQDQSVIWSVVPGSAGYPGSWGGHAVPIIKYDAEGPTCVTWGGLQKMTWEFYDRYCDEAYAIISQQWLVNQVTPTGINLQQLYLDLRAVD